MKQIVNVTVIVCAMILSCCTKETEPLNNPDGDMVAVQLNLDGEVLEDDIPLTRAFTSNDLIGVQVYQNSEYYAYGLFDDVSKIRLFLHTGKKYKFVCTVVKNGKNIIYIPSAGTGIGLPLDSSSSKYTVDFSGGQYSLPFITTGKSVVSSDGVNVSNHYSGMAMSNAFIYSSSVHFVSSLLYGRIATGLWDYKDYPQADRFYGWVENYSATKNGTLSIPMKRVGFRLTLSVSGITDGNVAVTIKNSVQTFANNTGITTDKQFGTTTWSFFDLANVYKYADNYAENFTVGVVWNRGVGVTQDLGTKTVQFKRNAVNHVKIKLTTTTRSSDSQMALEEPEITNETYSFGD